MKTKSGFILRRVGDSYLIVPVGAEAQKFNGIIKLNETGKFLWEKLGVGMSEKELIDAMLSEYDVSEQTARADVEAFVGKALAANLIER